MKTKKSQVVENTQINELNVMPKRTKRKPETNFQKALKVFIRTLKKDKNLYQAYHANLAMAYFDNANWNKSRDSYQKKLNIGNDAATYFLKLLFR